MSELDPVVPARSCSAFALTLLSDHVRADADPPALVVAFNVSQEPQTGPFVGQVGGCVGE